MKSKFSLTAIASVFILSTSCSSLVESTRKSLLGDSGKQRKAQPQQVKWVSKAQYDDLMGKYKSTLAKYEKLKEEKLTSQDKFEKLDELSASMNGETIDVFGDKGILNKKSESSAPVVAIKAEKSSNENSYEKSLNFYNKAIALKFNGKSTEALKVFQYLQNSKFDQIRVHAKKQIGDIYLEKGSFDLALQVYDQIIGKHAYSSEVLNALKGAVMCSKKLGLTEKTMKYESLLKDVFEVRS